MTITPATIAALESAYESVRIAYNSLNLISQEEARELNFESQQDYIMGNLDSAQDLIHKILEDYKPTKR
jgi:hypothetical protein